MQRSHFTYCVNGGDKDREEFKKFLKRTKGRYGYIERAMEKDKKVSQEVNLIKKRAEKCII